MSDDNDIEFLTVELSNVTSKSVYFFISLLTLTPSHLSSSEIQQSQHSMGYKGTNNDGAAFEEWIDKHQLNLIHDPKLPPSFHSTRWMRGYNPDLAIVTNNISDMCKKIVLDSVPLITQYQSIGILPFQRRFNYKKADWNGFAKELESEEDHTLLQTIMTSFPNLFPRLLVEYNTKTLQGGIHYQGFPRSVQKNTKGMLPCLKLNPSPRKRWQRVRKLRNCQTPTSESNWPFQHRN